jgi:hypothetical protein
MSLIEYGHKDGEQYVTEQVDTGNQVAEIKGHIPYHKLRVETDADSIVGDGQDTVTVTVSVLSGLDYVANGRETVISYTGEVTGTVDGTERTAEITDGRVSFEITTEKPAGETVEIEASTLADHPAQSDTVTVEIVE